MKDWENARTAVSGLIATGDRIEDHYRTFADLWGRDDHPGNAYYWTQKAIEVEPDDPNLYMQAASLSEIVGTGPSPIEWIDSAIAVFGENDALLNNKATLLARLEKYAEAEMILRPLYAKDTSNYTNHHLRRNSTYIWWNPTSRFNCFLR